MNTMGKVPWLVGRRTRNLARIRGGRPYHCCLSFLAFHVLTLAFCLLIEPSIIRLATIRFARSGYVLKSTRGSGRAVQNPLRSLFSLTRTGFMLADVFHQVFWSNWTVSKACFSASSSSIVANLELPFDSPLYAEPVVVCSELHISLIVWTFGGPSGKAERKQKVGSLVNGFIKNRMLNESIIMGHWEDIWRCGDAVGHPLHSPTHRLQASTCGLNLNCTHIH